MERAGLRGPAAPPRRSRNHLLPFAARDVDEFTAALKRAKINAVAYHAGMETSERKRVHDLFSAEKCDVVVATVAFGMGIDRSNIRYVLHTGMPKSIEHYQQETGRAGRDGLEAECVLLYSAADAVLWKKLLRKSVAESETPVDPHYLKNAFRHIDDMEDYCRPVTCRHRSLVEYFGQQYESENCGACDLCTGQSEVLPEAQTIAKKILSCVYRANESFGVAHIASILRGADTAAIRERGHDKLSTYGILKGHSQRDLADWTGQLVGLGLVDKVGSEYPILKLNPSSWEVMRDDCARPACGTFPATSGGAADGTPRDRPKRTKTEAASWRGSTGPCSKSCGRCVLRSPDREASPPTWSSAMQRSATCAVPSVGIGENGVDLRLWRSQAPGFRTVVFRGPRCRLPCPRLIARQFTASQAGCLRPGPTGQGGQRTRRRSLPSGSDA